MKLNYRDYNFLIFIFLMPFTILLSILYMQKIAGFSNQFFYYLLYLLIIICLISFIISSLNTIDDLVKEDTDSTNKSLKISLMLCFSFIYIPIHYFYHYYHKYLWLAIIIIITQLSLLFIMNLSFKKQIEQMISSKYQVFLPTSRNYYFDNDNFVIDLSYDYLCEDLGDYVLSCSHQKNGSFIGVYSYLFSNYRLDELEDIYLFHLEQTIDYVKEAGYSYQEDYLDNINIINYEDMQILISSLDIDLDSDQVNDNRLIIIYEAKKKEDNIDVYQEMINKIKVNEILS